MVFNKIDKLFDLAIMMDCSQCPIHPQLQSTFYAALFKKSPEGLTYTAGLDGDTARLLQTVAWQTVQDYYSPKQAAK